MSSLPRIAVFVGWITALLPFSSALADGSSKKNVDRYGDPLPVSVVSRMGSVRLRHRDTVFAVAFSPDSKTLASGGNDYTLRLWDLADGKEIRHFGQPPLWGSGASTRPVRAVAFAPNGRYVAQGIGDGTIRVWEISTGKEPFKLPAGLGLIHALAFSPDGKLLAATANQLVRLFDATTGKQLRQVSGNELVSSVAFSPDSKRLAAGCGDGVIRFWQADSGKEVRAIEGHKGSVHSVAFSPDGKVLASAGQDRVIRLWDVTPGGDPNYSPQTWAAIPLLQRPTPLALLQSIEFFRLNKEIRQFTGHQDEVTCLAFSLDGKILGSGSLDQTLRLWDVGNGKQRASLADRVGPVHCLAFSADGSTLACGDGYCAIRLWALRTGKEIRLETGPLGPIHNVAFASDGNTLATASSDLTVRFWEPASGKERQMLRTPLGGPAVAFSPNWTIAATGCLDGKICIWDPATAKVLRYCQGHEGVVLAVALAPDGKTLVSGGQDKTVRLWEVASGQQLDRLGIADKAVQFVRFSPDGKMLAWGCGDETIHLRDLAAGKDLPALSENGADVGCIAFSPDGKLLAAGSRDSFVRVWEVATGKIHRQLEDHHGPVQSVAFSADGKTLACGSWLTAHLWEVATGKERGRFFDLDGDIRSLAFSPRGEELAAGTGCGSTLVCDLTGRFSARDAVAVELSPAQLEQLWTSLAGQDATAAYRAIWSLAGSPSNSVPFLQSHLRAAPVLEPREQQRIARLIAELDSDDFAGREKANQELAQLAQTVEPNLRKALEQRPTTEARARIELLLDKLHAPTGMRERLRESRAVEVLERIANPEARRCLAALAQGAPQAPLTQEAKATLERLPK